MWKEFSGILKDSDLPSQSHRRNDDEQRHRPRRSNSIASSYSSKIHSSRADDRDPRSNNGGPYVQPGLVMSDILTDQMPRSKSNSSRSARDQDEDRKFGDRDKSERSQSRDQDIERRQKRAKRDKKDQDLRRSKNDLDQEVGTSRGPDGFPGQVASSPFSQFPAQHDGPIPGPNGAIPEHPSLSSHVQDQFPGQFPTQSSAPYRPPLAASEGGPGLAAEYYGDYGQSVAEQPGNRVNTPSLIVGAEPHLQPALAVAAPPSEPSASGAVGAAASFFSGEIEADGAASTHSQQHPSTYVTVQSRPNNNYHSSSTPVIPTIGGTAIGSAAGYLIGSQFASHQQRPNHESSLGEASSEQSTITTHRPSFQMDDPNYFSASRPPKPGKQSSQSSHVPIYSVGVAGAAGLAAVAYEHNYHSSNQDPSSTPQYLTTSMAQRHRSRGPFRALVDFFKDPDGVAQFEEYSQIIGVCRHCFAPGSSPRDAPRKHHYGRRSSNERYGSSTRVDKDSRYYSSENEGRRNKKSWLATGLARYGLARVGESLFKEMDDSDNACSVKSSLLSPDGRKHRARRRSHSIERVETLFSDDGNSDKKELHDNVSNGTKRAASGTRRQSKTKSRSKDRKAGLTEAAIGAALGTSAVASSSGRQSHPPQGTSIKNKHTSQAPSPERRHRADEKEKKKKKKKKSDKGIFSFVKGSSSSSSLDLAYTSSQVKQRSSKRSNGKSKDDKKAEAALLGLGAAAAALALSDGRQGQRKKDVREHVGAKETKDHHGHGSAQAHISKKSSKIMDDELWESAAEDDYESMNSDLAYGEPVRRDSRASLSSESSGTSKWDWRWGSKRKPRTSSPRLRKSSDQSSFPASIDTTGASLTGAATTFPDQRQGSVMDSTSSLPLQHVYPVPTSDPSRFDVGREASIASSNRQVMFSRPGAVPLQHPRPIAPVSTTIYSSQTAYDHSYSAPTGPAVFSQTPTDHYPGRSDARHSTHEASIPGSFSRSEQQAEDTTPDYRIRRRDSSPAKFGEDSISSSMAPRRRSSAKDDSSAVRFDLTEEQEERDRRERRRKRKQDNERREAEQQKQIEKHRRTSQESSSKNAGSISKLQERSPEKSWVGPAAAGVVVAAMDAAAVSRSEDTREERRERRRRARELEDEKDVLSRSERRRQRDRGDREAAMKESSSLPNGDSASSEYAHSQGRPPEKQNKSVWQEAAAIQRSSSHENYGAFFTPLEFLNKPNDQVKITGANADADIDLEQVPQIVRVEPKRIHDLADWPEVSLADTDDKVNPSKPSFPWQVPRLRLVEPTPPSTRGSTPIHQPNDAGNEDIEEPRKEPSFSKITWGEDQNYQYTVIAPKEEHDESVEPLSGEKNGTDPLDSLRSTRERDLPDVEKHSHNDSTMESSSASYGEDVEFAATLAASAEDAGFDPSIVMNDPTYRRRDSPPGSMECSMPGRSDDEDKPRLNKKERKRKEEASKGQSQVDSSSPRDNDATVQDMISQVEESESQPSNYVPSKEVDDEQESTENADFESPQKGRKGSEPEDNFVEAPEIASKTSELEMYGSPTENVRSIMSTALISNEADSGRRSRKKSERDSTPFDDATSTVSSPSVAEASKDPKAKPKDKRKGSIWGRVLSESTGRSPREIGVKDATDEAGLVSFEEPKESQGPMEGKSESDVDDDHESKEQSSIGGTMSQIISRISQDLPAQNQRIALGPAFPDAGSVAQYLDHRMEPELVEGKQPKSFLGMGPEPPPPPDTRVKSEAPFHSLETTSLPTSPHAKSEIPRRRFSDAEISHPTQTTAALPSSPTAVPFHFRRPGRSSSSVRSLSQNPLPLEKSAADLPPRQKTRPRSTESKWSEEIRPSWLVERHRSHQEPSTDEMYPSLPSSHTTSRSSSIHGLKGSEHDQRGPSKVDKTESESKPTAVEPGPIISTNSHLIQSDLLNSQQAAPTASSVLGTVQDLPSLQASRGSPPTVVAQENHQQSFSALEIGLLGATFGDSATLALKEAMHNDDPSRQDLSREETEESEHGLDDVDLKNCTYASDNENPDQEDSASRKIQTAGQFQQELLQGSHAEAVEARRSTGSIDVEPPSPDSTRQIREQSAQHAEGPWPPSCPPSNNGRKGDGRALLETQLEEIGPPPNTYEPPWDDAKYTAPAEGQEIDTLTREMSREQTVDVMAAAAQDGNKAGNESSQSATAVFQEQFEIQVEENRSESTSKRGTEGRRSLPPDDDAQEDLQTMTLSQQEHVQEQPRDDLLQHKLPRRDLEQDTLPCYDIPQGGLPQIETHQQTQPQGDLPKVILPRDDLSQSQDNVPQDRIPQNHAGPDSMSALSSATANLTSTESPSEKNLEKVQPSLEANALPQNGFDHGDLTAILPPLELSPRATPLPDSDYDHDLLDELSPRATPLPDSDYDHDLLDEQTAILSPLELSPRATPLPDSDYDHDLLDEQTAILPPLELSPRATPLPDSDHDHDLLDEQPETSIPTYLDYVDNKEVEIVAKNRFDSSHVHDLSAVIPGPQKLSQLLPAQAEQDTDKYFAARSKKGSKQGKKGSQSFSVQDGENTEVEEKDGPIPDVLKSTMLEDNHLKKPNNEPAKDVSQEKPEVVEEEWSSFTRTETGKKGKKTKQSDSVENSKTTDVQKGQQPLPIIAVSGAPKGHDPENTTDESALDISQLKIRPFEDESTGSDGKKQRRIGKKVKPSFSFENSQAVEVEETESPFKVAAFGAPEHHGSRGLIHEYAMHVPNPELVEDDSIHLTGVPTKQALKPEMVEDKWAGFDNKEKSRPGESQEESNAQNLEAGPEEIDNQFERQIDARDDMNSRNPSSATMRTSQEVRALLDSNGTKAATGGESEATTSTVSQAEHTLEQSSADQVSSRDEPSKPAVYKSETPQFKDDPGNACETERSPTLDTSVAGTNAAQIVQDVLTGEDNAATATCAEKEAIVASTGMEESATNKLVEEDGPDWDASRKKKKGKRGKKNEASSSDKPKSTEAAEISSPPGTIKTPLEQERMGDKQMDKDDLDWAGPKKKKKGKKGKKNEVFSLDRPEIEEPAEPSAAMNAPPMEPEPAARAADGVSSKRSRGDKGKKGKRKDVLRAVSEVRDEDEPNVIATEVPQDENLVEDFHGIAGASRDNVESSPVLRRIPKDDDRNEDLLACGMPPMRAANYAPGTALEPARPTRPAQDDDNEESREVPLEQEQDFMPPISKKDKKRQKKSKKFNAFSLDDDEILPLADRKTFGTNNLEKDRPEETTALSTDFVENSEKITRMRQSEQREDFTLPTNKKDKKKSKKSKKFGAFPLHPDVSPTLEDEPVSEVNGLEKAAPELTPPYSADVVKAHEEFVEGIPEEKEDREESKESEPIERKSDGVIAQSEQEATPDLNKDPQVDSNIGPLNVWGDLGIVEGKSGEAMHGYFKPVSAHAGALDIPHEATSSVLSPLAEPAPANASGEIIAYQANKSEDNIGSAVETDMDPLYGLEPSQEDVKRAMKAQPLTLEKDEIPQEPRAVFRGSSAAEDPVESSIVQISRDSESWSKSKLHAQENESTEIVRPDSRSEKDHGVQGSVLEGQPSQARGDIHTTTGVEQEESVATNKEKGKKSKINEGEKLYIPEPEEDRSSAEEKKPVSVTAASSAQEKAQTLEQQPRDGFHTAEEMPIDQEEPVAGERSEQYSILTGFGAINDEFHSGVPVQSAAKREQQQDGTHWDESRIELFTSSASPEPVSETVETMPDLEPLPHVEPLGSPDTDNTVPAVEVKMLDAQEQRLYNEKYAKELERQLSPLQEGERADLSRVEADGPVFPIGSVMEKTYEGEHRPLARPPALEDIAEESRSRSGSIQGSPADREDDLSPFKSAKRSRKGKKGKRQQPVIWEDETATPLLKLEGDRTAKPPIESLEVSGTCDTDAAPPIDLVEPRDQRSLEDKTVASPSGGFQAANKQFSTENKSSDDYLAIQPSRPEEEGMGREDTQSFHRALSPEPQYSTRERSPAGKPQTARHGQPRDDAVKAYNAPGEVDRLATDFHYKTGTEAELAEDQFEDNIGPPAVKKIQKGKDSKKKASAREPSPQAPGQESLAERPQEFETSTTDNLIHRPLSRQHSLRSTPNEDETCSVAEVPTSRGGSGIMEGVTAVAVLGVGIEAAENLFRTDSKEEENPDKKAKEGSKRKGSEAQTGETESPLDRGEIAFKEQEHRQTPESENSGTTRQHHQATPPLPTSSANHEAIVDHSLVGDLGQSPGTPKDRDSAIYVSGSPMISEEIPSLRAIRDSGYIDTEASPIIDDELKNQDNLTELERGIKGGEAVGHVHHRHIGAYETDGRQESRSRNPLEIHVEANSDYNVSASRPREKRKRSRGRSGGAYDSDDSADSGFDMQRRRRQQATAEEPREPSPVSSTTKDRSSAFFYSSPSAWEATVAKPQDQEVSLPYDPSRGGLTRSFDRETSTKERSRESSREGGSVNVPEPAPGSTGHEFPTGNHKDTGTSLFGGPQSSEDDLKSLSGSPRSSESRGRRRLKTISEDGADGSPLHNKDKRAVSDIRPHESDVEDQRIWSPPVEDDVAENHVSTYNPISRQAWPTADEEQHAVGERSRSRNSDQLSTFSSHQRRTRGEEYRTASASISSENSIHAIIRTRDGTLTPPLRRVDRSASGDLRGASQKSEAKSHAKSSSEHADLGIIGIPSSSTYDPVTDKGKSPANMADVYEGWGDVRGQSPMSPTRPPSMRKRQSMQLLDLESRLDQIVSENRLLASQKLTAERALQEQARDHSQERHAYEDAMQEHKIYLTRKDAELSELKRVIEQLHDQAAHLTEVNDGLVSSRGMDEEHEHRYNQLQAEHAQTHEQWQQSTRELDDLKEQHSQLSTGMEDIVRHEVTVALEEKNLELRQLQSELENAKQQVRNLQQQLSASRNSDDFVERDEDYFDSHCQSLCQHVQQWVLRFSKFSDMKACYLASEIRDEKVVDRIENAILDGSDVDDYLSDRVKRRDVFMSVVMTMIWEFIFTRYLFGMDREQRQKLKTLEKTLQEVGPMSAVHKWRATTLTLLMQREAFEHQRATDTQAVVHEIYDTLATFLPPPSHLVGQIQDSLRKVIDMAVDLSVEMRTQRAEYSMLPPLQPEYDTNGDLARKVYFSALTMNERSGATSSNEALQEQHAVVRMVLFPLVVKNEDDDEQIVVCPAQVLTAEGSKSKKTVRVMSAQGGRSEASFAGSDVRMEGGMI